MCRGYDRGWCRVTKLTMTAFARRHNTSKQNVWQWAKKGWIVRDGNLVIVEASELRLAARQRKQRQHQRERAEVAAIEAVKPVRPRSTPPHQVIKQVTTPVVLDVPTIAHRLTVRAATLEANGEVEVAKDLRRGVELIRLLDRELADVCKATKRLSAAHSNSLSEAPAQQRRRDGE